MKIAIAYIFVPHLPQLNALAGRFITSYLAHHPGEAHSTIIICNGSAPDQKQREQFRQFPDCSFVTRSNDGWDIGGYIEAAKQSDADMMVCLGASAHFKKPGWLARMAEAFQKHGPGLYAPCASFQVRPHLNTGIFFCQPDLLRRYPVTVMDKSDRYRFEHGPQCFWMRVAREKFPVKLVTWSGEYDWRDWRKPVNIYWRGDQSNCIAHWRLTDAYEQANGNDRRIMSAMADHLTDTHFRRIHSQRNVMV